MIDSILIGMSGLNAYAEGLRVISNNASNLDTPGFKGSSLQFGDMFYTQAGTNGSLDGQQGFGVDTLGTTLDFTAGDLQQTGNNLDLGVDGQGLFTLQDDHGALHYTRDGQFTFDSSGVLVDKTDGDKVIGISSTGAQGPMTLDGFRTNAPKATSTVVFSGNIPQSQPTVTLGTVNVLDSAGTAHALSLTLTSNQTTAPGVWNVVVDDGTTQVGTGTLAFPGGQIDPSRSKITFNYQPAGQPSQSVTLDFSSGVTSTTLSGASTLVQASQDGYATGTLTGESFDASGTLVYAYSNGQTTNGSRLLLARFDTTNAVASDGNNEFDATAPAQWHVGTAGDNGLGNIRSGVVEASNVDLSQEFSELVIMQRGYQASSEIVSTANDMLQQLFSMSDGK